MKTKHTFEYWQWRVIICSMIGYALFYFVRKNFAFAMPSLGEEYGITNTSFGIILSLVGIIYGLSKFVNGIIADRTVARWHLAIGLAACSVFNLVFGWSDKLSMLITGQTGGAEFVSTMVIIMATLLVLNNVFQGCGFPPCNHLLAWWVPPKELATKTAVWNTSHSIGAALAAVFCGYIIARTGNWRYCFFAPAAIGFVGVLFIVLTLRDTPSSVGLPDLPDTKTEIDNDDTPEAFRAFVKKFAVLDWGPTFLQQREVPLSPELAGWTIGIFEIAGLLGMLAAGWISDHFFHSKTHRVCAVEMLLTGACLLILHLVRDTASPVVILLLLALAGFFLYGPQALLGVTASKQATKKAASSALGIIGIMSYVSVIFTGAGLGWYSDHFGWDSLYLLMAGVSAVGFIFVAVLWNIKDDGYLKEETK